VRGAWWRVSDARARVDAGEPSVKGNGRDASPSRRFDGSRAPSTERPIRHSVVAEKSTRAAPRGETTTSDATAVSSARARETYRRARSRPPPSRPRSLRRRTPRGAVTRRTRKTRAVVRDVGGVRKSTRRAPTCRVVIWTRKTRLVRVRRDTPATS
jgi:hypothetical protein